MCDMNTSLRTYLRVVREKKKKVSRTCLTKEHSSLVGKYANLQEEPEKHLERVARWTIF